MYVRPIVALMSYGYIVFLFIQALVNPLDHISFIYGFGLFIFISEFLSIHSSAMLSGQRHVRDGLILTAVYVVLALAFSLALGTYYPAIILILSIVAKSALSTAPALGPSAAGMTNDKDFIGSGIILLSTSLTVSVFGWVIAALLPFSEAVYAQKPPGSSGLFVDTPQTLLVWGVLYYSVLIIWQASGPFRHAKSSNAKTYRTTAQK